MKSRVRVAMRSWIHALLGFSLGFLICSPGEASIHVLDLTTNGAAGTDLDNGIAHIFGGGITLTASAISSVGIPVVNATGGATGRLGVNLDNDGSDVANEIDAAFGEELTFTLTFGSPFTLTLLSIDLVGVGPTTPGDDAFVYINADPAVVLHTGVANFNGTSDVWTPAGGISLNSGDTIRFVAANTFGLEAISFDVVTPEPVSLCVWMIGIACCLCHRRNR